VACGPHGAEGARPGGLPGSAHAAAARGGRGSCSSGWGRSPVHHSGVYVGVIHPDGVLKTRDAGLNS
jgi:hypothetical protein